MTDTPTTSHPGPARASGPAEAPAEPAKIRFEQLQLGELAYLEKSTGTTFQSLGDLMADEHRSMLPMLQGLGVILLRRRGHPQAGPADADQLTADDIMGAFDMGDDTDPE